MTRLLSGGLGLAGMAIVLMTVPNLQSQTEEQDPRTVSDRPAPPESQIPAAEFFSESEFAFQQRREQTPPSRGQERPGPPDRNGGFRSPFQPPPLEPLGAALDTNEDGELSADEISAARRTLLKLDRNRNGQLDRDELPRPQFGGPPGGGFGPPGGRPGGTGGPDREIVKLAEKFDANGNGYLEAAERIEARRSLADRPVRRGGPGGRGPGSRVGPPPEPGRQIAKDQVSLFPDADLYDSSVLRTVFIDLDVDDWEDELAAFYRTDVEVPADLTIDGKTYSNVGVRFRGNSSFFSLSKGQKRSLNLSLDLVDKKQRIDGYRTLNLLNSHADSSFLRTVLFDRIAREYIPAPKANLVRVVINGENWGVFINEQQVNSDFIEEWFDERKGDRWKVPPDFSGGGALSWKSDNPEDYRRSYEIKSNDTADAWEALVEICRTLKNIPDEKIETELDAQLNIDRALWFLALDNVFGDGDGYFSRGSDYYLYRDARFGRFHLLPHDSNETFRLGGGGDFGRGPGGRGPGRDGLPGFGPAGGERPGNNRPGEFGTASGDRNRRPGESAGGQSPVLHEKESRLPVVSRLLAVPALRARYLAHVRTIATEWLDWNKLGPLFDAHHALIFDAVQEDTRKLYSFEDFVDAENAESLGRGPGAKAIGFRRFAEARREFLLSHPEIDRPLPGIQSVTQVKNAKPGTPTAITIHAHSGEIEPDQVILYYSTGIEAPFRTALVASSEQGIYTASIPGLPGGTMVRYYVEARSDTETGTTVFFPNKAEAGALQFTVAPEFTGGSSVIISEVLASNSRIADPQGEFDDYVELHNTGKVAVDLSGRFLTDSRSNLRKWKFPAGTMIPSGGRLVVWADEDERATSGLHASFKLSKKGETVFLVDSDARRNVVLDSLQFPALRSDIAFGRGSNGDYEPIAPSPGE